MKLYEVLQKSSPKIKTTTKSRTVSDIIRHKDQQMIGTGVQAIAYLHKKFPDKIIKTVQFDHFSDPGYQFIRLALNHQDNPYFPRIYAVKEYKTKEVSYSQRIQDRTELDPEHKLDKLPAQQSRTLLVVMEKLYPLDMTQDILDQFGITNIARFVHRTDLKSTKLTDSTKTFMAIRAAFESAKMRQEMIRFVVDPKLKQALRLLEPLFRIHRPDMHYENIMRRSTGDIVFMDPISYKSAIY